MILQANIWNNTRNIIKNLYILAIQNIMITFIIHNMIDDTYKN